MKKIFLKFYHGLRSINLEKKVSLLLAISILSTSAVLLVVATSSAVASLTEKSHSLAAQQIDSLSKNMENSLSDYKDLLMLLMLDDRIQGYLKADRGEKGYTSLTNAANQSLVYIRNAKPSIGYVFVVCEKNNEAQSLKQDYGVLNPLMGNKNYLYNGMNMVDFDEEYLPMPEEYTQNTFGTTGKLRYRMQQLKNGQWMLQLFQPVYDKFRLGKILGVLCIGINEEELSQFCSVGSGEMAFRTRITDNEGEILYDLEKEYIGENEEFANQMSGKSGSFSFESNMVLYRSISKWNMRLVGSISLRDLLRDSNRTTALLLFLIGILTLASLFACMRLTHRLCTPLRDVVRKMQVVSDGNLAVRMDEAISGNDFKEISENFNRMVCKLENLMERIKLEERRSQQTRFNILQSQIQPHFLYNTLECIHWQAAANGDKEVSEMVTALAAYYRQCLSRGQDVIPLWQEITLVKQYLTIQNMRYDNIIEMEFEIEKSLENVLLPKMTLQPLVENSIYHGIKDSGKTHGVVRLSARAEKDTAVLIYSDDGAGMAPDKIREINDSFAELDASFGYGVRNVHRRIEILFAPGYGLCYKGKKAGGLTVEIRFPITYRRESKRGG